MNLSAAFLIAGTGLAANGRATAVVSSNVANALTEGYARREAVMAQAFPAAGSNGVRVATVTRHVDERLQGEARLAGGAAAGAALLADFGVRAETAVGQPGDDGALQTILARLESSFVESALRPDSEARLAELGTSLSDAARAFRRTSDSIQQLRTAADNGIAFDVSRLNAGLQAVEQIDRRIVALIASGGDAAPLQDERQQIINGLAEIVPLREIRQPDGRATLVTTGGLTLLDSRVAQISFVPTRLVTAEMALGGPLSGLTIDGRPITMNGDAGLMDGGTLAARFEIRDQVAPAAQAELDALARDLVERLSDQTLDPTVAPGAAGLLTDAGAAFDPVNEVGLSARLTVNAGVDPAAGGGRFRLRDGLGAAAPGPIGDGALLARAASLLAGDRVTASTAVPAGQRSLAELAADITSVAATRRLDAERGEAQSVAQSAAFRDAIAATGVNSDAEMQRLIVLEQAYAANARVLSVVDALFAELLEAVR